ncbi:MAG: YidC/Oxa1 family membrane protein insertase [Acidimicrobiales bacterium]
MFDSIFEFAARILDFFYGLIPNFAIAIMLMTLLVMLVTTPLTLKGTRGMIKMQLLQPELKKIQEKHKGGDRQEMNAELMAFYQENNLNPLGGCLPLLVQAPVFLLLFRLIQGLTRTGADGTFDPKYLDEGSSLYRALDRREEMVSFGLDLAESTSQAVGDSIIHGLPYLILILIMIGAQYFQQKQVSARNPDGGMAMPQQKILLRVMPAFFGIISINFPAALVVYWVTSSIYRIGLQAYITRALYAGEESLGSQANKAAAKAREMNKSKTDAPSKDKPSKDKSGGKPSKDTAIDATATEDTAADTNGKPSPPGKPAGKRSKGAGANGGAAPPPIGGGSRARGSGSYQPGSKKKKRRRR